MKIFFENNKAKIRFQLTMDNDWLFDFTIDNEDYYSLVNHIDNNLKDFEKNNEKHLRLKKK